MDFNFLCLLCCCYGFWTLDFLLWGVDCSFISKGGVSLNISAGELGVL